MTESIQVQPEAPGHRQRGARKPLHKRVWFWFLIIVAAIMVFLAGVAFGSSNGEDDSTPAGSPASTAASSEAAKPAASIVGGRYEGVQDGYGVGVFTVRNDGKQPLKIVTLTIAELDGSGNIKRETYPQLQSDLQPGQSADVDFELSPQELAAAKSVQVTKISWGLKADEGHSQEASVKSILLNVK